jgi:ribose 5-phosphate isomerase RpiB
MATEFLPTAGISRFYFTQYNNPRSNAADGHTTNTSTTITSATASFNATYDVGATITGTGIPNGTTISSVTNSTTAVISQAATATNTNTVFTITQTNTNALAQFQANLISDWGASGTVAQLLPSTFQVLVNSNAPSTALVIDQNSQVHSVAQTQWLGFNQGAWSVVNNSLMTGGGGSTYTPATV